MPSEAVLEVLELLPVWRVRLPAAPMCWMLPVVTLDGCQGMFVLPEAPAGAAERLLGNLLLGLALRAEQPVETTLSSLTDLLRQYGVQWVWWLADDEAPDCAGILRMAGPSLAAMLADPVKKAKAWQDWCAARMQMMENSAG